MADHTPAERSAPWVGPGGIEVINQSDVPTDALLAHLRQNPEIAALTRWAQGIASPHAREGGLFERDRYLTPFNIYDQMRVAYEAGESDDIVSGVLESTEALSLGGFSLDAEDEDEEDIWNQIGEDLELDVCLRQIWRELFLVSQMYGVCWWGKKNYKVRGRTNQGTQRKKTFKDLTVPTGFTVLDPLKVLPVGNLMFNQEQLVYIAVPGESQQFERIISEGLSDDTIVSQLITGRYEPTHHERVRITQLGLPADHLYFLNPRNVFRITLTRPNYQRFANVRLRAVFELLDMKQQLRNADRSHLIGAASFIMLVKKGTDQLPATAGEVLALSQSVKTVSKVPIIVGDHRLSVEIITPDQEFVLNEEKWGTLDTRIASRLYQMFTLGSSAKTGARDDSLKLARVVARGMEARRMLIRKALERHVFNRIYDINTQLTTRPTLNFHPRRISLDFDPAVAVFLQDLRDRGDLSRESILQELDFAQVTEARNREREQKSFDKIFETQNPWGGTPAGGPPKQQTMGQGVGPMPRPIPQDPAASGKALGGNHQGGGARGGARGQGTSKPGTSDDTKKNRSNPSDS